MRMRRSTCWSCALVAGLLAWIGAGACDTAAARRERLGSNNPLDRAQAATEASRSQDPLAVHKLVDLLEDPDAAVRMYAILALRRMCGEDFGYRYYENEGARAEAVRRWRDALREGRVGVRPATQPAGEEVP